jgi:hypothetical protein
MRYGKDMDVHVRRIDAMVSEGVPFERVEAYIDGLALDDESKSALWLYLWVQTDPNARRTAVLEVLGELHLV